MGQPASRHSTSQTLWVAAFTLAIAAGAAHVPTASTVIRPPTAPVVAGDQAPLQQYRALRRMHAQSEKSKHEGWLDAWTEYDGRGFRYQIVAERGSDMVRNRVLKAVLEREQELALGGHSGKGDLTDANYEFGAETVTDGLRHVVIKPKRRDVVLVDGRIVLTGDGDLVRVEGKLAKNPSFWTTEVNVVRHYARVDGVRVPVATESVAKIRFVGPSRLNVRYEYESINNRTVGTAATPAPAMTLASAR